MKKNIFLPALFFLLSCGNDPDAVKNDKADTSSKDTMQTQTMKNENPNDYFMRLWNMFKANDSLNWKSTFTPEEQSKFNDEQDVFDSYRNWKKEMEKLVNEKYNGDPLSVKILDLGENKLGFISGKDTLRLRYKRVNGLICQDEK